MQMAETMNYIIIANLNNSTIILTDSSIINKNT